MNQDEERNQIERIALKFFPEAFAQPIEQGTSFSGSCQAVTMGSDCNETARNACKAAMIELVLARASSPPTLDTLTINNATSDRAENLHTLQLKSVAKIGEPVRPVPSKVHNPTEVRDGLSLPEKSALRASSPPTPKENHVQTSEVVHDTGLAGNSGACADVLPGADLLVESERVRLNAQHFYSAVWIKEHGSDVRGDWPIRFAEAYARYVASPPTPTIQLGTCIGGWDGHEGPHELRTLCVHWRPIKEEVMANGYGATASHTRESTAVPGAAHPVEETREELARRSWEEGRDAGANVCTDFAQNVGQHSQRTARLLEIQIRALQYPGLPVGSTRSTGGEIK